MSQNVKVLCGSTNPVKIAAVKEAFEKYFPAVEVQGIKAPSGVPEQPVGKETFTGARNRAFHLLEINKEKNLGADFFVGIEGGISNEYGFWFAFGGVCIVDKEGREAYGTSPQFQLPQSIVNKLLAGIELGEVMDELQNEKNTKQRHGAVGYFSKDVINRRQLYVTGVLMAIIPLLNKDLFFNDDY